MSQMKIAILALIFLSILTGIIYPLLVTGVAQALFPERANGSLIEKNDKIVGSSLIGQQFTDPKYFWGRYSATTPYPYNGAASRGSNFGPLNPNYLSDVKTRVDLLKTANPDSTGDVPVDLVTASASGLDPEISPRAALYQVARVAKLRNLNEKALQDLILANTKGRFLGIFGEPRVNLLALNLALDDLGNNT